MKSPKTRVSESPAAYGKPRARKKATPRPPAEPEEPPLPPGCRYPRKEFARRGKLIYQSVVLPNAKPRDIGKFAAIDIETGEYELHLDEMIASNNLRMRVHTAQIWMERIGYPAARTLRRIWPAERPMIIGRVDDNSAHIRLTVHGPHGHQEIDAIVDTGYSGALTLPRTIISNLGLDFDRFDDARLTDGSVCILDVFRAVAIWDEQIRFIPVDAAEAPSIVGMRLLEGHELKIQIRPAAKSKSNASKNLEPLNP